MKRLVILTVLLFLGGCQHFFEYRLFDQSYVAHGYYIGESKDVQLWVTAIRFGDAGPDKVLAISLVIQNNRRDSIYFSNKVNRLKLGAQDLLEQSHLEARIGPGKVLESHLRFRLPEEAPKQGTLVIDGITIPDIGKVPFHSISFYKHDFD